MTARNKFERAQDLVAQSMHGMEEAIEELEGEIEGLEEKLEKALDLNEILEARIADLEDKIGDLEG